MKSGSAGREEIFIDVISSSLNTEKGFTNRNQSYNITVNSSSANKVSLSPSTDKSCTSSKSPNHHKPDKAKNENGPAIIQSEQMTREKAKSFYCGPCQKSFKQKIHLIKHSAKHTGIKPFKCSVCSYSTVERSHLRVHVRVHTKEKPFKCSLCEYATAQSSTLNIHKKRHHNTLKSNISQITPNFLIADKKASNLNCTYDELENNLSKECQQQNDMPLSNRYTQTHYQLDVESTELLDENKKMMSKLLGLANVALQQANS